MNHFAVSLLQIADGAAQGTPNACGAAGGAQSLIFMVLMFAVFYFVLIRPQSKKQKEHQAMINNLKSGDQVITRGGMLGKVTGVKDGVITLEIQEKIRIRVLKNYIEGIYNPQPQSNAADKATSTTPSDAKT